MKWQSYVIIWIVSQPSCLYLCVNCSSLRQLCVSKEIKFWRKKINRKWRIFCQSSLFSLLFLFLIKVSDLPINMFKMSVNFWFILQNFYHDSKLLLGCRTLHGKKCNQLDVLNRTSSMPKSILHYVLDKGKYFDLESVFTQSCFPNKD